MSGQGGDSPMAPRLKNAVNDALKTLGAEVSETPISPRRVLAAIARAHDMEMI